MTQYGKTAVKAVQICIQQSISPINAWELACEEIIKSEESRKKGCPKNTFIGLCEADLVKGIVGGEYLKKSSKNLNKEYAVRAVGLLTNEPSLLNNKKKLWEHVTNTKKAHNSQMDVVISLFKAGLLNI